MRTSALLLALLVLAGCADSPEPRFFVLGAVPPSGEPPPVAGDPVVVDAVEIPDVLDRPELVRRIGAYRVEVSNVNRWAAPLAEMVRDVLIEDLAQRLPKTLLPLSDRPGGGAPRILLVHIHDFAPRSSGRVVLDVAWSVLEGSERKATLRRRETIAVDVPAPGPAGQADGMSRALGELADHIVAALAGGS